MQGRAFVVSGWRGLLVGGLFLALVLFAIFAFSVVTMAALAVGVLMLIGRRALGVFGFRRREPHARPRPVQIIEGEYRVIERRSSEGSGK